MESNKASFQIIHPHAAGVDVGSRSHFVAIDQNKDNVREFGVYTKDHQEMISHLRQHGVTTATAARHHHGKYRQLLADLVQCPPTSRI